MTAKSCRRREHVWKVTDRQEQPSSVETMESLGTPITGNGLWPHDILLMTHRPVIVARECVRCGTQEVVRV